MMSPVLLRLISAPFATSTRALPASPAAPATPITLPRLRLLDPAVIEHRDVGVVGLLTLLELQAGAAHARLYLPAAAEREDEHRRADHDREHPIQGLSGIPPSRQDISSSVSASLS